MGDVAISVPVLRAFIAQNPSVKLTILTRPFFAPLFNDIAITILGFNLLGDGLRTSLDPVERR